jgi:hypothetical protein
LDRNEINEEIYPSTLDPHKLMDMVDGITDDKLLKDITKV